MLSAMRFKDFTWPHNPRTFRVEWQRRVAVLDAPGGRYRVQELGKTCRVLRGEGEFCGPDAYETFERLAETFSQDGPGALRHPLWHANAGYFTRLELTQEPRADYVAYAFEFDETRDEVPEVPVGVHIVQAGESLWSIAAAYGMEVPELLSRNPGLQNPNLLAVGQEVIVG